MSDSLVVSVNPSDIPATTRLTKSQTAALQYLLDDDPEASELAFDWLIGICYKAVQNLFTIDGHSEYLGPSGAENTEHTRRREFVIDWLCEYFKPFKILEADNLRGVLEEATPEFRWIGRKCKFAFLKEIRNCPVCGKRKVKQCLTCGHMLSHQQMNTKGLSHCPECAAALKRNHHLVCKEECQPLSVRTSLDACYGDDGNADLSEYVVLEVPQPIREWLRSSKPDLEALALYTGFSIFAEAMLNGSGIRSITRAWAELEGVSLKVARSRKKKFFIAVEIARDHKLVREFYRHIERVSDGPKLGLAVAESKQTKLARQARSEAARELAEFSKGLTPETARQSADAARELADAATSADQDEIRSRRNPEIASSTRFRETDAGLGHARREAELDSLLEECDVSEVIAYLGMKPDPELTEEELRQQILQGVTEFAGYTGVELQPNEATGYDMSLPD